MDRRDFLKVLGGVALIPLVPSAAFANSPTDLKTWFEANFNCKQGEPKADITVGNKTYTYYTFAVGVLNGTETEAKQRISQYFIEKFSPIAKGKPDLWWRVEPQFVSDKVTTFGDTWMTAEEIEDGGVRNNEFYKPSGGYTGNKGYVPFKWKEVQKPDDVELDFETNSYRYVKSTDTLHKMRFRLIIPTHAQQLDAFAHIEGNFVGKI